jgi:hypothetical protein
MLSRGMIFNSLAIVFALYKFTNKINLKLDIKFYLKLLSSLFIAFFISVISVNELRISKFNFGDSPKVENNIEYKEKITISEKFNSNTSKSFYRLYHLLIHRWVGIDSMLIITRDKNFLNFGLFYRSLKEKYNSKSISFYEENFQIKPLDYYEKNDSLKGNTLPGLMTFLFYSGSYTFLFFLIILFSFFATILEYLIYKSTNKNLIASGLIGMVVSYRFAHFGYLPSRSYLLFGSIIGLIILFFSIKFFFQFIKIRLNK